MVQEAAACTGSCFGRHLTKHAQEAGLGGVGGGLRHLLQQGLDTDNVQAISTSALIPYELLYGK
jgi:hypothetical protein